jgi:hypothetical protein
MDFWLHLPPSDPQFRMKRALLDGHPLTQEHTYDFVGTLGGDHHISERLLASLRIILMHESEIASRYNVRRDAGTIYLYLYLSIYLYGME